MGDRELLLDAIKVLEERNKKASVLRSKYKNMTYAKVLQEPENSLRLMRVELSQKDTFFKLCKKDEIHKNDWKDEFAMYWIGFLKGEYKCINEYLNRNQNTH